MMKTTDGKRRTVRRTADGKSWKERLEGMTDEELMAQFQAGTIEAFDILVDRYSERLSYYLYKFVKDWNRVEDLLQETFLRVYRNRHGYEPIAKFSTWLYTIAGNLARSEYRKRKRRPKQPLHAVGPGGEEFELPIPADVHGPNHVAAHRLHGEDIDEALSKLPDPYREVVVLRDVQQLTYEEIAEITGLPIGTVKSRIHRGRSKLQEELRHIFESV